MITREREMERVEVNYLPINLRRLSLTEERLQPLIRDQLARDYRKMADGVTGNEYPILPSGTAVYRAVLLDEITPTIQSEGCQFITRRNRAGFSYELPVTEQIEEALRFARRRLIFSSPNTGGPLLLEMSRYRVNPQVSKHEDTLFDIVRNVGLGMLSPNCQAHIRERLFDLPQFF